MNRPSALQTSRIHLPQLRAAEFTDKEDCLPLLEWVLSSSVSSKFPYCVLIIWECKQTFQSGRVEKEKVWITEAHQNRFLSHFLTKKAREHEALGSLGRFYSLYCNKRFWEPFPNPVKRDSILTSGCCTDVSKNVTERLVSGLLQRCFKLWLYISILGASWGGTMFSSCWRTSLLPSTVPGM